MGKVTKRLKEVIIMRNRQMPLWVVVLLLIATSACSMPVPATLTPEVMIELTPDAIYTAAVQTVIAQLTENAPTPTPTETEAPPEATLPAEDTPLPTAEGTEIPLPTNTSTPTPTVTGTPEPEELTPSADPVNELGSPSWEDTFNPPQAWALISDSHAHFEIVDGQLNMTAYNADYWNSWSLTQPNIEVFYMEAEGSSTTCSGRDRWGLFFRAPDYTRGYLFGISCDGRYALWIWNGAQEIYLIDWMESEHILKGEGQVNRIGVDADGNRISLYANGNLLTEIRDDSYSSGRFGLFVGAAETPGYSVTVERIAYWENP
jgi:hypothetical protein